MWTKTLSRKVHFESYTQSKGTAKKGLTWTSQTVAFFYVLHLSLLNQINDNRLLLVFVVPLTSDFSIIFFLKKQNYFQKPREGTVTSLWNKQHCVSQQNAFNFLATLNVCICNLQQHWTGNSNLELNSSTWLNGHCYWSHWVVAVNTWPSPTASEKKTFPVKYFTCILLTIIWHILKINSCTMYPWNPTLSTILSAFFKELSQL